MHFAIALSMLSLLFPTMQILNQFKDEGLEDDLIDMQRYAAWKAADIRKALREGRTPTPGAPGGGDVPAASTLTPSGMLQCTVQQHLPCHTLPVYHLDIQLVIQAQLCL